MWLRLVGARADRPRRLPAATAPSTRRPRGRSPAHGSRRRRTRRRATRSSPPYLELAVRDDGRPDRGWRLDGVGAGTPEVHVRFGIGRESTRPTCRGACAARSPTPRRASRSASRPSARARTAGTREGPLAGLLLEQHEAVSGVAHALRRVHRHHRRPPGPGRASATARGGRQSARRRRVGRLASLETVARGLSPSRPRAGSARRNFGLELDELEREIGSTGSRASRRTNDDVVLEANATEAAARYRPGSTVKIIPGASGVSVRGTRNGGWWMPRPMAWPAPWTTSPRSGRVSRITAPPPRRRVPACPGHRPRSPPPARPGRAPTPHVPSPTEGRRSRSA